MGAGSCGDGGTFVEVTQHNDVLTLADETIHNPADFDGLAAALFITTPGLGLKMIDEDVNQQAGRGADGVLGAVAAEDQTDRIAVIDVGADGFDLKAGSGHDADIDAAVIVAVDQHHMLVHIRQQFTVKADEGRAVLGFDNGDYISIHFLENPGGHADTEIIGRLDGKLNPANPVVAASGFDLDIEGVIRRLAVENPTVLAEPCPAGRGGVFAADSALAVDVVEVEDDHQVAHAGFIGGGIGSKLEKVVQFRIGFQDGLADSPIGGVESPGAGEQVFDIIGCDPDHLRGLLFRVRAARLGSMGWV